MPRKFLLALMTLLIPAQWTFEGTAQADAVEFTLKAKMLAGQKETPHLILRINERLESLKVTLTREDGVTFDKSYVRVEAGGETRIDLPVVRGKNHHFKAAFDIGMDGETLHHETEFDAELITAPEFKVRNEDVNVDGGFLSLTSSRDIARIDVTVTNDEGKTVAKKSQNEGRQTLTAVKSVGQNRQKSRKMSVRTDKNFRKCRSEPTKKPPFRAGKRAFDRGA